MAQVTLECPGAKIASLNYCSPPRLQQITTLHAPGSGFSHVINKKRYRAGYLPPDANCLLSVFDHCLRSRHYVNVWFGKARAPQW